MPNNTQILDQLMINTPLPKDIINIVLNYDFRFEGKYIGKLGASHFEDFYCIWTQLATDGENIYMCFGNCIKTINQKGEVIFESELSNNKIGLTDVAITGSELFATDCLGQRVIVYRLPDLKIIRYFKCFDSCRCICINNSKIYISRSNEIQICNLRGDLLAQIQLKTVKYIQGIYATDDKLYISNSCGEKIITLTKDGEFLSELRFYDKNGTLMRNAKKIMILDNHIYFNNVSQVFKCTMDGVVVKKWGIRRHGFYEPQLYHFLFLNNKCYMSNSRNEIDVYK